VAPGEGLTVLTKFRAWQNEARSFDELRAFALEGRRWAGANRLGAPADLGPQHLTQRRTLGVTSAITSKLRPHATGG
jgi:hypothetical protein